MKGKNKFLYARIGKVFTKTKKVLPFAVFIFLVLVNIDSVSAHCPVCTAAVGTGVAVTRFYGIDDTIVGVWIGAFIVSTALWFNIVLKKKYKKQIPLQSFLLILLALIFTVVPFYFAGLIGNMHNKILGIDKLLLGTLIGSAVTWLGIFVSDKIKKRRSKVLFPFQTIIMVLISLVLASLVFWYIVG